MKTKLKNLTSATITGEWGFENDNYPNVFVIRATNFDNNGKIDFTNIVERAILKKSKENGQLKLEVDFEKIELKKLVDDDIIIEKSGGGPNTPVGRVVFFKNPDNKTYLCNNFTQIIRIDKTKINPKYLFYNLQYFYNTKRVLKYQNQTTGLINLKLNKYLQEETEVPSSDFQIKVITQLQIIEDLIELRKKSIAILDKLISSYFFDCFGDVVNNQKRFPLKKLSEVVKKEKIITYGIVQAGPHVEDGIPYIRSGDIKNGVINSTKLLKTSNEIANKFQKTKCSQGDIIITIRATIGDVGIITEELDGVNLTRGTALISADENIVNKFYLLHLLSTEGFKFLLSKHVKGSTFKEISLKKLREIKIPISNNKNMQKKFSENFQKIFSQKEKLIQSYSLLENLYNSVLNSSFNSKKIINEESIFSDLIKQFTIDDLKEKKDRLQFLINLFSENKFKDKDTYNVAKEKLFELLDDDIIEQTFDGENININVK